MVRRRNVLAVVFGVGVLVVGLAVAGCGDDGSTETGGTTATGPSTTLSTPLAVDVSGPTPYTSTKDVTVFAPTEGSDWPVVVYFHGGVVPDDYPTESDRSLFTAVAEQGVVVYAPHWQSTGPAGGSQDSVCAMAFAQQTADEHGGDPSDVTLAGYSAGGYSAVIHGFLAEDPPLAVTDCVVDPSAQPARAAVSGGGPFFVADAARAGLLPDPAWTSLTPEEIDDFDPYLVLDRNPDLQVRLWVGAADVGGNPNQPFPIADSNREYHAALVDAGFDVELVEVPGGHEVESTRRAEFVDLIVETARSG